MDKKEVILLGNPLLRQVAEPIADNEFGTPELRQLEQTLFDCLVAENGLGLAAPQIGISKRAFVFGMKKHPVHTHVPAIPFTILFNPSYEALSDEWVEDYEGCLSVGALRGKVSRYKHIRYQGYDADGTLIKREAFDLHARVVQHEYDHLDGVIFLDKIAHVNSLGFHDELIKSGELKAQKSA